MTETKHTQGAVSAAEALWDDEKHFGPHSCKANYVTKAATIIDRETGLPTLQTKIDRLEAEIGEYIDELQCLSQDHKRLEAEKAELVETLEQIRIQASEAVGIISSLHDHIGDKLCGIVTQIRNMCYTAIAVIGRPETAAVGWEVRSDDGILR